MTLNPEASEALQAQVVQVWAAAWPGVQLLYQCSISGSASRAGAEQGSLLCGNNAAPQRCAAVAQ